MRVLSALSTFASIGLATLANSSPFSSPVKREVTSKILPDVKLRFVADSGVCETTPGVHQMSGYIDVGTNMSMVRYQNQQVHTLLIVICIQWFWFFEARESPETAPFTLWYGFCMEHVALV